MYLDSVTDMIGKGESGATRKFTAILCRKQEEGNVSMSITPAYKLSSLVQTFHTIALQVFFTRFGWSCTSAGTMGNSTVVEQEQRTTHYNFFYFLTFSIHI